MRKMYVKFKECIGGRLHGLCDRFTPRQRAIVVIVMASLFALVNFYMIFRAIYDIVPTPGRSRQPGFAIMPCSPQFLNGSS